MAGCSCDASTIRATPVACHVAGGWRHTGTLTPLFFPPFSSDGPSSIFHLSSLVHSSSTNSYSSLLLEGKEQHVLYWSRLYTMVPGVHHVIITMIATVVFGRMGAASSLRRVATPQLPPLSLLFVSVIPNHNYLYASSLSMIGGTISRQHPSSTLRDGCAADEGVASLGLYRRYHHRVSPSRMTMSPTATEQSDEHQSPITYMMYDCIDDDEGEDDIDDTKNDIDSDSGNDGSIDCIDNNAHTSLLRHALITSVQSALQALSRKTASLERELAKARALEDTMKRANLIVSNLYRLPPGTVSAEVEDWENGGEIITLTLNTKEYNSAQEESDDLFALARKMKRGSKIVEELMEQSLSGERILQKALLDLEMAEDDDDKLLLVQDHLEHISSKTGFKSPSMVEATTTSSSQSRKRSPKKSISRVSNNEPNPRILKSPSGHQVLVGRNRRDNEAICFQLSRPTDVWMHARGCPGAHVLLCVRRGSPAVQEEDMQFAANLAAFYSNARTETKAAITTAEPKHITKPRGAPLGAVSLRQEGKTIIGRPEDVADHLKEAREKSGAAWDELGYRALGTRVKNTKKTAAAEKAKRDKSREDAMSKNKRRKRKEEQESWY
jgi:hypothetical protein